MNNHQILFLTIMSIVFIIVFIACLNKGINNFWTIIGDIIFSAIAGFFFGGIISVLISIIGTAGLKKEERIRQSYNLVALDTNEDIHGSYSNFFFVGNGYIGEDMYYHFYYNTSKGIKYKKILAENCYIIESNELPTYRIYNQYIIDKSSMFYENTPQGSDKEVLIIPKGTIKNNYKVN